MTAGDRALAAAACALIIAACVPEVFLNAANVILLRSVGEASAPRFAAAYEATRIHMSNAAAVRWARAALRYGGGGRATAALGRACLASGNSQLGVSLLEDAAASGRVCVAVIAGNARMAQGDRAGALRDWLLAVPTPELRLQLARSLYEQSTTSTGVAIPDRCRDALFVLEAMRTSTSLKIQREAAILRATVYDELDDRQSAIRIADELLARDPDDAQAQDLKMILLIRNADDSAAIALATRVLARRASWVAFFVRGSAHLHRCELTQALRDLRNALELPSEGDYHNTWIHHDLAAALWESGDVPGSVAEWREYQRLQPNVPGLDDVIAAARSGRLPRRCGTARTMS